MASKQQEVQEVQDVTSMASTVTCDTKGRGHYWKVVDDGMAVTTRHGRWASGTSYCLLCGKGAHSLKENPGDDCAVDGFFGGSGERDE